MSPVLSKLVCYIGRDEEFWRNLRLELSIKDEMLSFFQIINEKDIGFDVLACQLVHDPPCLLLIDFSMPLEGILSLIFNLKAEFRIQNVSLVGLFDDLKNRILLKKALSLGIPTALIKELGTLELTQSLQDLITPERILDTLRKKDFLLEAQNLLRIGFIGPDYIHLESSWKFQDNELVHLETGLASELALPAVFKVLRTGDRNIYSSAKFWQDIEPVYLDEPRLLVFGKRLQTYKALLKKTPKNKRLKYEVALIQNDLDLLINKAYKAESNFPDKVHRWMNFSRDFSRPKRTRVLVIDPQMRLLGEEKEYLDSFSFSLRSYSKLHDDEDIIKRNLPGIVVIECKKTEDDTKTLRRLVELISREESYHPLIVLFNCSLKLEDVKKEFSYSAIMIQPYSLNLKKLQIVAERFEKSHGRIATHGISFGDKEERFYLSKYDERSVASFVMEFKVRKMSERGIIFSSDRPIPHQSIFYIKYPIKMTLTVFRCSGLEKDESLGLIHGIGKEEKKMLLQILESL